MFLWGGMGSLHRAIWFPRKVFWLSLGRAHADVASQGQQAKPPPVLFIHMCILGRGFLENKCSEHNTPSKTTANDKNVRF